MSFKIGDRVVVHFNDSIQYPAPVAPPVQKKHYLLDLAGAVDMMDALGVLDMIHSPASEYVARHRAA